MSDEIYLLFLMNILGYKSFAVNLRGHGGSGDKKRILSASSHALPLVVSLHLD